jgi:hypothetical protein
MSPPKKSRPAANGAAESRRAATAAREGTTSTATDASPWDFGPGTDCMTGRCDHQPDTTTTFTRPDWPEFLELVDARLSRKRREP